MIQHPNGTTEVTSSSPCEGEQLHNQICTPSDT